MEIRENLAKVFAERLKDLMFEHGVTIKKLSQELNIPQSTIDSWLLLKHLPKVDGLYLVARYFKVTTDYMLGIEN